MKKLNSWGPWKDNPSKLDNFYDINESFEDENIEELDEEVIEEELDEETIDNVIAEEEKEENSSKENITETKSEDVDPYASILNDLK